MTFHFIKVLKKVILLNFFLNIWRSILASNLYAKLEFVLKTGKKKVRSEKLAGTPCVNVTFMVKFLQWLLAYVSQMIANQPYSYCTSAADD